MTQYKWLLHMAEGANGNKMTAKKVQIIQAAIELFAEKGYSATSTKEIAERAQVSEGAIFKHFGTKKELIVSISEMIIGEVIFPMIGRNLEQVLHDSYDSFEDFALALLQNRMEIVQEVLPLFRLLLQELPFHPEIRQTFIKFLSGLQFEAAVQKLQDQGLVVEGPPQLIMQYILSSLIGFIMFRFIIMPELFTQQPETLKTTALPEDTGKFLIDFMSHGLVRDA